MIQIDLYTAHFCPSCRQAQTRLQRVLDEFSPADVNLDCIDVVENIDRAVALGILATPAIAIDGKLVFTKLPSDAHLRQTMRQAIGDARLKMS